MRRFLLMALLTLTVTTLSAEESSLSAAFDLRSFDRVFTPTLDATFDVRLHVSPEFTLRLPFSLTSEQGYNDIHLWEFGLFLDYYPLQKSLFISVSLIQIGIFSGRDRPKESLLYLNEVGFGYTWHISKALYCEPRLLITDPSGVFESEYEEVGRWFPSTKKFRLSLLFGWNILAFPASDGREG